MLYVTGMNALNVPCNLDTIGDWHKEHYNWKHPDCMESEDSPLKNYGIDYRYVEDFHKSVYIANHIRALLDLLYRGMFSYCLGMRYMYIDNERYNSEVYRQVYRLKGENQWNRIDEFMTNEYGLEWTQYKQRQEETE